MGATCRTANKTNEKPRGGYCYLDLSLTECVIYDLFSARFAPLLRTIRYVWMPVRGEKETALNAAEGAEVSRSTSSLRLTVLIPRNKARRREQMDLHGFEMTFVRGCCTFRRLPCRKLARNFKAQHSIYPA
jgi:hypothetical protein